jgi:hypothetical protein
LLYARVLRKFFDFIGNIFESIARCKGFKEKSMNVLLYARVLRRFFDFIAICKGFKETSLCLLLFARVLRKMH